MEVLKIYTSLLYAPEKSFGDALAGKVRTLFFPLIAAIMITALLNIYYYNAIDFSWFLKQVIVNIPESQKQSALDSLTKTRMVSVSLVGVLFLTVSINLFRAFVYWFVFTVKGNTQRFIRLFAVVMWSTAPLLLILPAGILNIYMNANMGMMPNDVNPVSLNQLYFKLPGDSSWGQMLSTFSLINIWELFLIVIGLRILTSQKTGGLVIIAMLPEIIVYGLWVALLLI